MGRGLSVQTQQLIQRAYDVLEVEHPSGVRRVAYALFGNAAGKWVKKLGKALVKARRRGIIPWEWISDSSRSEVAPFVVEDMTSLAEMNRLCPSYDPWPEQGVRVMVWSEKAVSGTLQPVLARYLVGFMVHHGNTSWTWIHEATLRARVRELVILYVGDHDPKGLRISEDDLPTRFGLLKAVNVTVKRVALLGSDLARLDHLRDPIKKGDKDRDWYRSHTGLDHGVELEAIPSTELRDRVDAAIRAEIVDVAAWNHSRQLSRVVQESWEAYVDQWQPPSIAGLGSE